MGIIDVLRRPKFELGHLVLRDPKVKGPVRYDASSADDVQRALEGTGLSVVPLRVNQREYRDFVARADYARFGSYYAWNRPSFAEKSLEHYLAAKLLELREGSVHVDVASDTSPAREIYADVYGVTAYRQDLSFPAGVVGNRIGGDAAAMPVRDGFADTMSLHCSFEHFEGDSDMRFIAECARVLRPGGRVCILPLYMSPRYSVMTDLGVVGWRSQPAFEEDATVYSAIGYGQRHGRFYDAAHLQSRVLGRLGALRATIHRVTNLEEIGPACYVHFALTLERPAA
ncbi:MAG: methyltransferase domain-containing protein [Gemmatimonadota bacterium]